MLGPQELISERYLIQHHLHHGYMSEVYQAYDQQLQCDVAIKVVCHDQTESKLRLQSEMQALSSLLHDHILPILDYGEHGMYHYLVMPYCKQGALLQRISQETLTVEEVGRILSQVASALQFAHDHGIIHRDIKPSNILFVNEIDLHVYLADFGLAKVVAAGSDITQTGFLIGTPAYMAPELIDEPESVSSDIYALGILLYHMLTGRPPFRSANPLGVLWKHVREQPIPPSHLNPAITPPVEQVILQALHKDPKQRFSDARALAQAYTNALHSSQQSKVPLSLPIIEPEPTHVTVKKLDEKIPSAALQSDPLVWFRKDHRALQSVIISLAFVALFIIPLSLGILVGRDKAQISPAFGAAQFASALHKAAPPVSSLPASSPPSTPGGIPARGKTPGIDGGEDAGVLPARGKPIPQRVMPSVLHHKHKHPHHKHDNNTPIEIDA